MIEVGSIEERLQRGDRLHMQLVNGRRVWWFENPHQNVSDALVARLLAPGSNCSVREAGDSLFGLPLNSQTWFGGSNG